MRNRATPAARCASTTLETELQSYLVGASQDQENGLKFWVDHEMHYPLLAPLALDLLAAPASEAYVERVFLCLWQLDSWEKKPPDERT